MTEMKRIISLLTLIFICILQSAYGQEMQVPIDQEGKIFVIDLELRQKLEIFTELNDFQEARLFQTSDSMYIMEISYQQAGQSMRKREQMNTAQVMDLRTQVTQRIHQSAPKGTIDQSGRGTLIPTVVGLSFGYYGWSVPFLFDNIDSRAGVALYLLTAGGVCLYASSATSESEITQEGAIAFQYAATRGIVHSSALYSLITGPNIRWFIPFSAVGSAIEGVWAMHSVQNNKTTLGTIYAHGVFEDFGIGNGVGLAFLVREGDNFELDQDDLRLLGGMTLLGSGVGYLAGLWLTDIAPYTSGDADVLQTSGLLGMTLAFTISDLAGAEKRKPLVTSSMVGSIAGLAIGHILTSNNNFSDEAGTSVRLYTSLGAIVGLGTAYALSSESSGRSLYFSSATLGALCGFTIAYLSANKEVSPTNQSHSWNVKIDANRTNQYTVSPNR